MSSEFQFLFMANFFLFFFRFKITYRSTTIEPWLHLYAIMIIISISISVCICVYVIVHVFLCFCMGARVNSWEKERDWERRTRISVIVVVFSLLSMWWYVYRIEYTVYTHTKRARARQTGGQWPLRFRNLEIYQNWTTAVSLSYIYYIYTNHSDAIAMCDDLCGCVGCVLCAYWWSNDQ